VKLAEIGTLSVEEACEKLGKSRRTIFRYLRKLKNGGIDNLNYQSHKAWNRTDSKTEKRVIELKEERRDRSSAFIQHLMQKKYKQQIHLSAVKRILKRSGIDFTRNIIKEPIKPYEMKHFGDMWQIDTFERTCIRNHPKVYVVLIIDDYSRAVLAGMGFNRDSTPNNLLLTRVAIEGYGIPHSIKSDNDTKFRPTRNKKGETELVRACRELGCVMFPHKPFNPKSKGKIEKRIQFIDEWFIKENTFKNLGDLNRRLGKFIAWFNTEFKVSTTESIPVKLMKNSSTRKIPKCLNLDDVFCTKIFRYVKRDCTIHYKSKKYSVNKKYIGEKVELHIVEYKKIIRVWRKKKLIKQVTI
jgi:transposase